MGIDIGGEFHVLKQGKKRKEPSGTTEGPGMEQVPNCLGEQSPCSTRKKRDCRVREKQVRKRFGLSLSTDEEDIEWETAQYNRHGSKTRYEAYYHLIEEYMDGDDDDDDEVEPSGFRYRGPVLQIVDDGFGGYGREVF
jgi:hypothetical protein